MPPPTLIDWSGDRTRALFTGPQGLPAMGQITLASGLMTSFSLAQPGQFLAYPAGYTRPNGTNLLALGNPSGGTSLRLERLERFDLTGALQATLATGNFNGSPASSPDGTVVAVGTGGRVELVSNAGGSSRLVPVPGVNPRLGCSVARWSDSSTVLASCLPSSSSPRSQLWLVPAGAGAPTALTPARPADSKDLGDYDAWQLNSGLYLQASGPGCMQLIFRQAADGSITQINVPDAGGSAAILAVAGGRLLLRAKNGCRHCTQSLLWYNPATGATQLLLSAQSGEQGVISAVPYSGRHG